MAEDWLDCPALGPGWKRREAFRKSGATCGRSDIYYQSPTGDKIRSKVELTRYLGPECDLTLFDFKQGIVCYPTPKTPLTVPSKKQKKPTKPAKTQKPAIPEPQRSKARKETPQNEIKANTGPASAPASFPAPGCCENCGIQFSEDAGTKRQRLKTLCKDCRAQRIAFNREQRMFKRIGCGECAACLVTVDCGACSTCLLQLPCDVASGLFCKCERRRCLRIVKRSQRCGVCRRCQIQEDCGRCQACLRPPRPGLRHQWRCVQRRCIWGKSKKGKGSSKAAARHRPPAQPASPLPALELSKAAARHRPPAQPASPLPASQLPKPTELHTSVLAPSSPAEFIYYCVDEDELKRLLPSVGSGSEEGTGSPPHHPRRKRPCSARRLCLGSSLKAPLAVHSAQPGHAQDPETQEASGGFVLPPPGTDLVFLREGASSPVQVPGPAAAPSEAPLQQDQCSVQSWVVALPQVKQEKVDAPEEWTSGPAAPTSAFQPDFPSKAADPGLLPVKQEPPDPEEEKEENKDYISESAPEEEAGGPGIPVITEIFSLGGTRFRDTEIWLPRPKDLKTPGARKQ